jgi:predicted DNA-binding protein (UPF0278 family)
MNLHTLKLIAANAIKNEPTTKERIQKQVDFCIYLVRKNPNGYDVNIPADLAEIFEEAVDNISDDHPDKFYCYRVDKDADVACFSIARTASALVAHERAR